MKQFLIFLFAFIGITANAQIQFWNTADIENLQWEPLYTSQKVRKITFNQVDENNRQIIPGMLNSVKVYDANFKLMATARYKYNWVNKKSELLQSDSFFYNPQKKLIRFSSFEGPEKRRVAESEFFYDAKGHQIRQDKYTFENYERKKEGSETIVWSPAGKAVKLTSKNTPAVPDHTRQFSYDANGNLARAVFTSSGSTTTEFTWNEKNLLTGYKEYNGKVMNKEVTFIYDDEGRRISKHTDTPYGYRDNTTYIYKGKEMLPYVTHMSYSGSGGKDDTRFEHMELLYDIY